MKKLFKWIMAIILYYSGILRLFERFYPYSRNGAWILEYHRVSYDKDDILKMVVSPKHFEKQMRYLKRRYNIIRLREIVERIENHERLPTRSIAITFDDGYRDNYTFAYPVLKKFNIPATIFVVTDHIGTDNLLWFDELLVMVNASSVGRIALTSNEHEEVYNLLNADSKNRLTLRLLDIIKNIGPRERRQYLDKLKDLLQVSNVGDPERMVLNWQEIKEMSNNNIDFGSHGRTHTALTKLEIYEVEDEIYSSKRAIEAILSRPAFIFSYPYGREVDFDNFIIPRIRQAGYRAACVNILGKNRDKRDLFSLKRRGIEVESSTNIFDGYSRAVFACEISGIFDFLFFRIEREYLS